MMTVLSKKNPDKFYLGFTLLKQQLFSFDSRCRFAFPSPWRRPSIFSIFGVNFPKISTNAALASMGELESRLVWPPNASF
jgi:hypothetical protein